MIFLAASATKTRISAEVGEPRPAGSEPDRAKGSFSAVLARQAPQKAEANGESRQAKSPAGKVDAASDPQCAPAAPDGIAVPEAAEGGKELPVGLPVIAVEAEGQLDLPPEEAAADVVPAVPAVPQIPLPGTPAADDGGEKADTGNSTPPRAAVPHQVIAALAAGPAAGEAKPADGEQATGAPRAPAVALQVGSGPAMKTAEAAPAAGDMDAEAESDTPAARPRELAFDRGAPRFSPVETARQSEPAPAGATPAPPAPAAPASTGTQPTMQADALHELTRIVDRLAAAREAFAPAAEALAIEHAEFGELSLRFDQRRDGSLSVQLSASNPEAHRAVAQAVGAQTFQSAADERAGQPQGQTQNQAQTAARGGAADRESASGNGGAARQEQQASQQRQPAPQQQPDGGRRRAGVFA